MNAIWYDDWDVHSDKLYKRPCCPECRVPIGKLPSGEYRCYSCGEIVSVTDKKMTDWFKAREETKIEYEDCRIVESIDKKYKHGCGGVKTLKVSYRRNPATLEWQAVTGECSACGLRWIV